MPTAVQKPRTFLTPPRNFDPIKATSKELLLHGFPRRPSAELAGASALWNKAMVMYRDQKFDYVIPEFGLLPDEHKVKPVAHMQGENLALIANEEPSVFGDYSGVVVFPQDFANNPMQGISPRFTIPNIYPAPNPNQFGPNFWTYAWLGVDGL